MAENAFQQAIREYLEQRASDDALFAETFKKPGKNIEDCCTYILNEVKKSGREGFADAEVFSMAVHYYDEDDIEVGKKQNCKVVVNRTIEKPAAPAKPAATTQQTAKPAAKKTAAKKEISNQGTLSLF